MIQEPARVQATTYEEVQSDVRTAGERTLSSNCNCSRMRTEPTATTKDLPRSTTALTCTTIPIVINTHPNPRIILIKVPNRSSSNNSSSNSNINNNQNHTCNSSNSNCSSSNNTCNRAELTAPRTRLIRIPFLPGSVPTPPSTNQALPTASSLVSSTTSATASRIATQTLPATGTIYPTERYLSSSESQKNQVAIDPKIGPPTTVNQTVQVSSHHQQQPQTLASMAGVELTGADMLSHQDMSGAMPTATVEEIDVPVFIDEYLQNIEASSSTSCSSKTEENGKEICSETDIFDFDFDINLIAEDLIERKEMNQCSQDMDINNSDNINNNFTYMDELQFPLDEGGEEMTLDVSSMCNGIEFSTEDEPDLLISSQNPMFPCYSQGSELPSSQTKCFHELPLLADENSLETTNYYGSSQASLGFGLGLGQLELSSEGVSVVCQEATTSTQCLGVKRSAAAAGLMPIIDSMPPKRSNLILNINKSHVHQPEIVNTPDIIEQVLKLSEQNQATSFTTQDKIYEDLRSTEENTTFSDTQDFSAPNTPYSAYSVSTSTTSNAPTCLTGFAGLITAPVSPAFSTASTSQFSSATSNNNGTKRKRGRPAKEHADGPDPELMSRLQGDELKLYQDRLKNNEASRVSRRKTKSREDAEKLEEENLLTISRDLTAILQKVEADKKMLEHHLMQMHHRNSTYVKPEPEH
ncbi:serine-rich adhesin for platelets isoform X1 [Drosophila nasuta]|nr:serine-rich adhesin for platelets isoform X1 [Drosophila nasuta]